MKAGPPAYEWGVRGGHELRKVSGKMEVRHRKTTLGVCVRIFQNVVLFFADNLIFFEHRNSNGKMHVNINRKCRWN